MRRSGMERLIDRLKARALLADGPLLDAGAGNCWLAHNLARLGSQVVAVDVNDDPLDGLVAGEHMLSSTIRFERILASFESLPFRTETFAAVIFNGSFHYASDQLGVLGHARRVVRRGGSIYVLDSPVYRRPSSGERMMSERGPGRARYVTLDSLERFAGTLDLDLRIDMPARSLSTTIRRKIHELRLRRGIACMPLIEFSRVR